MTLQQDSPTLLPDGFEGVCKIEKIYVRETRFGESFFCEMTTTGGERVVWRQSLAIPVVAEATLLQWAAAVSGVPPSNYRTGPGALRVQELLRQAAASPEANDFTQRYVRVSVSRVPTKNGRLFSLYRFSPYLEGAPPTTTKQTTHRGTRKVRLK